MADILIGVGASRKKSLFDESKVGELALFIMSLSTGQETTFGSIFLTSSFCCRSRCPFSFIIKSPEISAGCRPKLYLHIQLLFSLDSEQKFYCQDRNISCDHN